MRPVTVQVGPLAAASANCICLSQTPTTSFTIDGANAASGVAVLDTPRRVLFTPAGNESANTFTVRGTAGNTTLTEVIAGTNATAFYTNLDFDRITSITLSSPAAGAITVGTNGIASSSWVRFDDWALSQVAVQCDASGTVNYTVQQTLDDPNSPTSPVLPYQVTWINCADRAFVSSTTSGQTNYQFAPTFARVLLNSGSGSVTTTFTQFGVTPR